MPTNFEGPVTIDIPAGLDVAAVGGSSPSASTSGAGHPKLRLEMVSQVILLLGPMFTELTEYVVE